jgi:hypothetical protein
VPTGNVTVTSARWLPDGRQLLIVGTEPGKRLRAYVTDVNGATPRPISPEGISFTRRSLKLDPASGRRELLKEIHPSDPGSVGPTKVIITPDGRSYAADYPRAQMTLYLVEGLK